MEAPYRDIWFVDFEFYQAGGDPPSPLCLVARELHSNRLIRVFGEDLLKMESAPFPTDADTLFVAYYASAEIGCFLALKWPIPVRILDLYVEFRNHTNGMPLPHGSGLLGAMAYFGLNCIEAVEKTAMRDLALRGGPYTHAEAAALLDYCQSDVDALVDLLGRMWAHIDLPRALLRGRYMAAAARIERAGTPIDVPTFARLVRNWDAVKGKLLGRADRHGLWEKGSFRAARFAAFLEEHNIAWPVEEGRLKLDDTTFRMMAKARPEIASIQELRHTLSQLRLNDLAVGADGFNRCLLSVFRAKTSRNQPSNSKFIFGPSVWLRGLIKPPEGFAAAYVDYSQQEFGIAAAISGDVVMMDAYASGDPYMAFAIQAGAVPIDATKQSHPVDRSRFKVCVLAVQYGQGEDSLATKLGESKSTARHLLQLHRQTYRRYWEWNDDLVNSALLGFPLRTVFGWTLHPAGKLNARSLANFPSQAHGAEILRLAASMVTEGGITVCAPVHDALLVMAESDRIDEVVAATQALMAEASTIVLNGFELRSDAQIFRHPERYADERGVEMWGTVMDILDELEAGHVGPTCIAGVQAPVSALNTRAISS